MNNQIKKENIILVTDNFPFGKGEISFIVPELKVLKQYFNVTIISKSSSNIQTTKVQDIEVLHFAPLDKIGFVFYCIKCLFLPEFWSEINNIKHESNNVHLSVVGLFHFLSDALFFSKQYKKEQKRGRFFNCHIIYSYWNNYAVYALLRDKTKPDGIRVVTRTHGYDLYNERIPGNYQFYKNYIDQKIDALYFISNQGKQYYLDHFANKAIDNKYHVCYLGVPDHGINLGTTEPIRIVSCSNIIEVKRIDLLVKSLSIIDHIEIEWVHIGDGVCGNEIRELANSLLSEKENISYNFLGNLEHDDVINFYKKNAITLFINVSSSEGLPVSIMEACSFGIPVIATDVGGTKEIVGEKNGRLLPANPSENEIVMAILSCLNSDMNAMRSESRKKWGAFFNSEKNYSVFVKEIMGYKE